MASLGEGEQGQADGLFLHALIKDAGEVKGEGTNTSLIDWGLVRNVDLGQQCEYLAGMFGCVLSTILREEEHICGGRTSKVG